MASSVKTINSLLSQFTAANNAVVSGLQAGTSVASAQDQRDSIVTQLSQQIGVSTITAANGSMSIYADCGVTLFQDAARTVAFTPTPTLVDGQSGSPVTVDGVPNAFVPGTTAYLGRWVKHKIINDATQPLKFTWTFLPPGLDEFFASIGRPRAAGDPTPEPFERPGETLAIERRTGFGPPVGS